MESLLKRNEYNWGFLEYDVVTGCTTTNVREMRVIPSIGIISTCFVEVQLAVLFIRPGNCYKKCPVTHLMQREWHVHKVIYVHVIHCSDLTSSPASLVHGQGQQCSDSILCFTQ